VSRTRSPAIEALLLDRQREGEAAAATKDALDPDPSAVQLDEAPREREPEARALTLLDADARLLELLEDPLAVFAGEMPGPASVTMTSTSPSTRAEATTTRGATSVVLRSRNLGHANPSITLTFYAHPFDAAGTRNEPPPSSKQRPWGKAARKTAVASAGDRRRPRAVERRNSSRFGNR
jgi:hypothetical protein